MFNEVQPTVRPSEEDMNRFKAFFTDMFERMSNSVVDAAKLTTVVAELTAQVEELKRDVEYVRERNKDLDAALQAVRQQRDTAQQELAQARIEISRLVDERNQAVERGNHLEVSLSHLQSDYDTINAHRKEVITDLAETQRNFTDTLTSRNRLEETITDLEHRLDTVRKDYNLSQEELYQTIVDRDNHRDAALKANEALVGIRTMIERVFTGVVEATRQVA